MDKSEDNILYLATTNNTKLSILRKVYPSAKLIVPDCYDRPEMESGGLMGHAKYAELTAKRKIQSIVGRVFKNDETDGRILIGTSTVVSFEGHLIEKPQSPQEAYQTLKRLGGNEHWVITGVALKNITSTYKFHTKTKVKLTHLNEEMIESYLKGKGSFLSTGGCNPEGLGEVVIDHISGDYFSLLGMPIHDLVKHIKWLRENTNKELPLSGEMSDRKLPINKNEVTSSESQVVTF